MPLVIKLTKEIVEIEKYGFRQAWTPPATGLTKAALDTYEILKGSDYLLAKSTREEREEVMELFRHFGQALFCALFPPEYAAKIRQETCLAFDCPDEELYEWPLELLHDSISFLAQTHGILRLFQGRSPERFPKSGKILERLKVRLLGYRPMERPNFPKKEIPGDFQLYLEELALQENPGQSKIRFKVSANASRKDLIQALEDGPEILLFSGYDNQGRFELDGIHNKQGPDLELQRAFSNAVYEGLRLMILSSSSILEQSRKVEDYRDLGIPLLLSLPGRLSRKRFLSFFRELTRSLQREDSLLKAHRHSLNQLQAELPLSWDWAFLRLNVNQDLIHSELSNPLRGFVFSKFEPDPKPELPCCNGLSSRIFQGSDETLQEVIFHLLTAPQNKIIWLRSLEGQPLEDYLLEFFRRLKANHNFYWNLLYYHRWGFHQKEERNLERSELARRLGHIFNPEQAHQYFDQCLIPMQEGIERGLMYLTVFYPPDHPDPVFERWLQGKQKEGWQIVLISHTSFVTELPTEIISTDKLSHSEIERNFHQNLPELWAGLIEGQIPPQMRNIKLLELILRLGDEELIRAVASADSPQELWRAYFAKILTTLSNKGRQLFLALVLLRVKLSPRDLEELLRIEELPKYLNRLHDFGLIDSNLDQSLYWTPTHLWSQIHKLELIPKDLLIKSGKELLKNISVITNQKEDHLILLKSGFSYAVSDLFELGLSEGLIFRNLQFAKKLAHRLENRKDIIFQLLLDSLELSEHSDKQEVRNQCLLSVLGVLDGLSEPNEQIGLYHWFLQRAQDEKDWPLVSEITTRLAGLHADMGQSERALAYLTSALSLDTDIHHYGDRYKQLNAIAMLLLELDEYEKAEHLVETADFQPELLKDEQMTQLWLIDAHLLYFQRNKEEARKSLSALMKRDLSSIPKVLLAKTYRILAELEEVNSPEYLDYLHKSAELYQEANKWEQSFELHQALSEHYLAQNEADRACSHLEWIFHYHNRFKKRNEANRIANQLGGLFFKIGNQEKSTEYYKVAQGLSE